VEPPAEILSGSEGSGFEPLSRCADPKGKICSGVAALAAQPGNHNSITKEAELSNFTRHITVFTHYKSPVFMRFVARLMAITAGFYRPPVELYP
jgi:hypothetical protein